MGGGTMKHPEECETVGAPLGFETRLRTWRGRNGEETTKKPRFWRRLGRNKQPQDNSNTSSRAKIKILSQRTSSPMSTRTDEESEPSNSPSRHSHGTRDTMTPRRFEVTCPVGLEKGNRVDIRSPSGIMPVFSARVPTGKLAGDIFTVVAPSEEQLVQFEDKDTVSNLCGIRPYACGTTSNKDTITKTERPPTTHASSEESWPSISYTLDAWLTPTPEVVGRPLEQKH